MEDEKKTRAQLISELAEMRQRIALLEASKAERKEEDDLRLSAEILNLVRESEERYHSFIENFHGIAFHCDLAFRPVFFQGAVKAITGYAEEDFLAGDPRWDQLIHPDDLPDFCEGMEKICSSPGCSTEREYRILRNDGQLRWIHEIIQNIRDSSGNSKLLQGVFYDVTGRRQVEEDRTRLSLAVEQAAESMMITEPDGTIIYVNPAFERITGYSRDEVIGQNPRILKSGKQNAEFYRAMWSALMQGEVWSGHFVNRRKDGSLYEEDTIISPVRDANGKVLNYVAAKRDITQEVALEAQLRQAQKMEAIGTLAGGIAHDFNNLLSIITGFAQLALMGAGGTDKWREYVGRIPEKAQQASKLISQLLTFSRRVVVERVSLPLLPLVKETAKMLKRTVPENIDIQVRSSGDVWAVNADPTQMQQMLMNLCVNASQAMPDGGDMILSLENVTLDEAYCRQYTYARPGDYVYLSVRDTGVGMTPEVQARIFEPFFTTKPTGEGTGLGLSMVYGIVKTHEGHINVYSELGKGSEFKVYLPAVKKRAVSSGALRERPVGGKEALLLVEDDAEVLTTGRQMLEMLGYTIFTAANGAEAMEVYRVRQDEIAAVLTDMMMPKMSGLALYRALVEINPAVKVLVMSGYDLEEIAGDPHARGLKGFVEKPLDMHKLGQAVRGAIDG